MKMCSWCRGVDGDGRHLPLGALCLHARLRQHPGVVGVVGRRRPPCRVPYCTRRRRPTLTPCRGPRRHYSPLSPLLFVIVMEVLNQLIAEADRRGILSPLPGNVIKYRASVYVDDLVVFLSPSASAFSCIRQILGVGASHQLGEVPDYAD